MEEMPDYSRSNSMKEVVLTTPFSDSLSQMEELFEVPCTSLENISAYSNSTVSVSNPEKLPELTFLVNTMPQGWSVRRSFDDFVYFRSLLCSMFPGSYVPPQLPKRLSNSKEEALNKHLLFAERFLCAVLDHPLLQRSEPLEAFLKAESFEKHPIKAKKIENIHEFASVEGTAKCDSNRNIEFFDKINEYIESSHVVFRTLKKQSKKLEQAVKTVNECLGKISQSIKQLSTIQEIIPENRIFKSMLDSLSDSVKYWTVLEKELIGEIKQHATSAFKYSYNEVMPFVELLKEKEKAYKNYLNSCNKLDSKKEKLWQGDTSKWELSEDPGDINELRSNKELAFQKMLPCETQKVNALKEVYSHLNYKVLEELQWFIAHRNKRDRQNFIRLSQQEITRCSQQSLFGTNA